jgi:homoserine dehydrogenase
MAHYKLAFLGFGNVGKALAGLLIRKRLELEHEYDLTFSVTGITTSRHGQAVNLDGIDLEQALKVSDFSNLSKSPSESDVYQFIDQTNADVLFENTPVNYQTGQPAVDHLKYALERNMHAITANKGPVAHAYRMLTDLASQKERKFYFESTVMDGAPIFSLFRDTLPAARLRSFRGILNSTTNMILTRMEQGESFDQAVSYCQKIGIAETDPSGDVDGWDAAVKVAVLVNVLMDFRLKPEDVDRQGIREITQDDVSRALKDGKRWKLVCTAVRDGERIRTKVAPEMVTSNSILYTVDGTSSIVIFETDVLSSLSIVEANPSPHTTAYGLLADFLNAVKS